MAFRSKRQWRWAFATHKSWARRWAHETPSYRALPRSRGKGSVARRAAARVR